VSDLETPPPAPAPRRGSKFWNAVITSTLILASAGAAGNLRSYSIPSASMNPTLVMGDRILGVNRPLAGNPKRGEIWVFRSPLSSGTLFVKRVVAVPGDVVNVSGGKLTVNGTAASEPYVAGPTTYTLPPTTIQPGTYFVLGDNRNNSNDSHVFGPMPLSAFVSKLGVRFWPVQRAGGV
jgi:signal peptidase I